MARFKLTLEFEGTRYKGWQIQKGQVTVQGKILEVCKEIFKTEKLEIYGSGRTDAGVHALAQVAHLEVDTKLSPESIKAKLNELLPQDINILKIEIAHPRFHARHEAIARSYVYHITTRRTAFGRKYSWWVNEKLDLDKMKVVASLFTGFKDFRSFGQNDPDKKSTTVNVTEVNIHQEGDNIFIHIVGSHFLWKMVRRMVGVLVEVGKGNLTKEQVEGFFQNKSGEPAKHTAPATGLYLERVYYKDEEIADDFKYCLNI